MAQAPHTVWSVGSVSSKYESLNPKTVNLKPELHVSRQKVPILRVKGLGIRV